jgi:hypothetical protein
MSPQAGFLLQDQVIPRLRSAIPNVVHCVGAEDHNELIQDSIAMAAKMMHNVEEAGKSVTPGNIAYYTIQHIKSGRRSTGSSYVDVYGSRTQLNGTSRLNSLEEVVASAEEAGGEIFLFHDVLSQDEEDPGTKAARKMDWEDFVAALPKREKAMVEFMIEGKSGSSMARKLKVSDSTIRNSKRTLAIKIQEFMGFDILVQVQRRPEWKNNLASTKEKMACRHERHN